MELMTAASGNPADKGSVAAAGFAVSRDFNPPLAPWRERISWALYDFANTVFSMNIATLYFAAWLVGDLGHSNTLYATVNGIASALVVVSIPVFGAISDATQRRKPWVVGFTLIACLSTVLMAILGQIGLPLVGEGVAGTAASALVSPGIALFGVLAAFTLANYAYQARNLSNNAMLPELVPSISGGLGMGAAFGSWIDNRCSAHLPFFTRIATAGALPSASSAFQECYSLHESRWSSFHVRADGSAVSSVLVRYFYSAEITTQ